MGPKNDVNWEDSMEHGMGSGAELLVVEGESAASAVLRVRDPKLQAVLPMRGKPMNAWKAKPAAIAKHDFFAKLMECLRFDLNDPRYEMARFERVIILTDPDADGIHCGALLLIFFFKFYPQWIEEGRLLQVHAPKMQITALGLDEPRQIMTDRGANELVAALQKRGVHDIKKHVYRGLASLNSDILSRHCVNPATRKSHILHFHDAEQAVEIFCG